MPVRDFLKSLSATYRNRCPGLSETRNEYAPRLCGSTNAILHPPKREGELKDRVRAALHEPVIMIGR